jgi:catechol 2,3-dioxygenase-like lactoylglutathione lyase family enzyme
MLKKILIVVGVLIAALLIIVATRPADFHVERSATIAAPALALFEQVNNHHKFNAWNPFLKLDPNVKNTYSGPEAGVGAVCSWDGNRDIGAGSATIIESKPGELVRMRMDWKRPLEGTSTVDFTFKPEGDKTVVTWAMYGKNRFMGKLLSMFMDCDKMVGPQFEQGLANLKSLVESTARKGDCMKPRITMITIGVDDLERAVRFYRDGLGWPTQGIIGTEFEYGAVAFFDVQAGMKLALWPRKSIARDTGLAQASASPTEFTLAHNVASKAQVDAMMELAKKAGAVIVKPAQDTFWGGYAGYFQDPDQHLWEVAWNPQMPVQD